MSPHRPSIFSVESKELQVGESFRGNGHAASRLSLLTTEIW